VSAPDEFCAQLHALCRQYGYRSIDVSVGCDGSVQFWATCPRGYIVGMTQHADVPQEGHARGDPAPSVVLARWQHEHAKPVAEWTRQLDLFADSVASTVDRLGMLIDIAMAAGALRKRLENEASDELDCRPFERAARGPWCSDYGRQTGEHLAAYRGSLKSLGMELGANGVVRLVRCEHASPGAQAGWDEGCDATSDR
jgi:hypothetical protein